MRKEKAENTEVHQCIFEAQIINTNASVKIFCKMLVTWKNMANKIFCKTINDNAFLNNGMAIFNQTLSFQTYLLFDKQHQLYIKKETILCVLLVSARMPDEQKLVGRIVVDLAKVLNQKLFYQTQQHRLGFCSIPHASLRFNIECISKVRTEMKPLEYDLSQFSMITTNINHSKCQNQNHDDLAILKYFDKELYDKQIGNNKNYSLSKAKSAGSLRTYHQKQSQQQIQFGNKEITAPVSLLTFPQKQTNLQKTNNKNIPNKAVQTDKKPIILSIKNLNIKRIQQIQQNYINQFQNFKCQHQQSIQINRQKTQQQLILLQFKRKQLQKQNTRLTQMLLKSNQQYERQKLQCKKWKKQYEKINYKIKQIENIKNQIIQQFIQQIQQNRQKYQQIQAKLKQYDNIHIQLQNLKYKLYKKQQQNLLNQMIKIKQLEFFDQKLKIAMQQYEQSEKLRLDYEGQILQKLQDKIKPNQRSQKKDEEIYRLNRKIQELKLNKRSDTSKLYRSYGYFSNRETLGSEQIQTLKKRITKPTNQIQFTKDVKQNLYHFQQICEQVMNERQYLLAQINEIKQQKKQLILQKIQLEQLYQHQEIRINNQQNLGNIKNVQNPTKTSIQLSQNQQFENKLLVVQQQLLAVKNIVSKSQYDKQKLEQDLTRLKQQNQLIKQYIQKKSIQLIQIKKYKQLYQSLLKTNQNLQKQLKFLQQLLQNKQQQLVNMSKKGQQLTQQNIQLTNKLTEIKIQSQETKQNIKKIQTQQQQLKDIINNNNNIINQLDKKFIKLSQQQQEQKQYIQKSNRQIQNLKKALQIRSEQFITNKIQCDKMANQNILLKIYLRNIQLQSKQRRAELSRYKDIIDSLQEEKQKQQDIIQQLKGQIENQQIQALTCKNILQKLLKQNKQLKNLQNKKPTIQDQHQKLQYQKQLNKMFKNLQQQKQKKCITRITNISFCLEIEKNALKYSNFIIIILQNIFDVIERFKDIKLGGRIIRDQQFIQNNEGIIEIIQNTSLEPKKITLQIIIILTIINLTTKQIIILTIQQPSQTNNHISQLQIQSIQQISHTKQHQFNQSQNKLKISQQNKISHQTIIQKLRNKNNILLSDITKLKQNSIIMQEMNNKLYMIIRQLNDNIQYLNKQANKVDVQQQYKLKQKDNIIGELHNEIQLLKQQINNLKQNRTQSVLQSTQIQQISQYVNKLQKLQSQLLTKQSQLQILNQQLIQANKKINNLQYQCNVKKVKNINNSLYEQINLIKDKQQQENKKSQNNGLSVGNQNILKNQIIVACRNLQSILHTKYYNDKSLAIIEMMAGKNMLLEQYLNKITQQKGQIQQKARRLSMQFQKIKATILKGKGNFQQKNQFINLLKPCQGKVKDLIQMTQKIFDIEIQLTSQ